MSLPVDPGTAALLDLLLQDSQYGTLLIGAGHSILAVGGAAARLLNRPADALVGQCLADIGHQEPATPTPRFILAAPGNEMPAVRCQPVLTAEPGLQVLVLRAEPGSGHGGAAPRPWDTLLREGHHRIKNSLQALAALLHHQAGLAGKPGAILLEAVGQVRAMAAVHELCSRPEQPAVTLAELIEPLVRNLAGLYPDCPPIALPDCAALALPGSIVPPDQLTLLAIIVNELLTNAVQHGTAGSPESIRLDAREEPDGLRITLDNPGQLPAGFDFSRRQGLGNGLQLLAALLDPPHTTLHLHQTVPGTVSATLQLRAAEGRSQRNRPHVP